MSADARLSDLQTKLETKHKIYKLGEMLADCARSSTQIFIDTPPALNFYTLSALIARRALPDSLRLRRLLAPGAVSAARERRRDQARSQQEAEGRGIVVNQFNARSNLPTRVVDELIAEKLPVIPQYISTSIKIKESHEAAKPLIYMEPGHKVAQEYRALYELLDHKKR